MTSLDSYNSGKTTHKTKVTFTQRLSTTITNLGQVTELRCNTCSYSSHKNDYS